MIESRSELYVRALDLLERIYNEGRGREVFPPLPEYISDSDEIWEELVELTKKPE